MSLLHLRIFCLEEIRKRQEHRIQILRCNLIKKQKALLLLTDIKACTKFRHHVGEK